MTDLAATMADRGLVLLLRGGAWGLPTACPACLPVYMYLKLARVAFTPQYATFQPDSGLRFCDSLWFFLCIARLS